MWSDPIAIGFHDTISPNNCTAVKVPILSVADFSMVSQPAQLIVAFIHAALVVMIVIVVPVDFVSVFVRCGP